MDDPNSENVKSKTFSGLRYAYAALVIPFGMLVLSWFVPFLRPTLGTQALFPYCVCRCNHTSDHGNYLVGHSD